MAAVVQCAWIHGFPSSVSSSGNGRGAQWWKPRDANCRKAGASPRANGRGVVNVTLAQGGEEVVESCRDSAGNVFCFAQKAVVALALGLSLTIGGLFSFYHLNRSYLGERRTAVIGTEVGSVDGYTLRIFKTLATSDRNFNFLLSLESEECEHLSCAILRFLALDWN